MKEHSILKKLAAILMTVLLLVSASGTAGYRILAEEDSSTEVTFEQIENEGLGRLFSAKKEAAEESADPAVTEGDVRVSIVLQDKSTVEMGYAPQNIASDAAAKQYRASLKAKQDAMANTISKEVLNGEKLDVVWNITLAGNMISANVPYDAIEEIRQIVGVKEVVIETRYAPDVVSSSSDDPNMGTATEMVGSNYAWAAGFTGAGSKVAIIDTGLDTDHELFDSAAFDKAIAEDVTDGHAVTLMNATDVANVWDQLNASTFIRNNSGVYLTTKVPYAVNYVDKDLDVTHDNDGQGEHGSHVAGIATANRYVTDDNGGFVESLFKEGVFTQGEAPDAQLLIMKVFGKGGGAYDSDYMVAIEDAIVLGADSVNLSLGSASVGMTTTTYQDILDELSASSTISTNSAGNNYYWTEPTNVPYLYEDDISFATGGSPGSYPTSFTAASVDNKGSTGLYFGIEGKNYIYDDGSSANNAPLVSIAGTYEYVFVEGPGVSDNNYSNNVFEALGDVVNGKVAFCSRGSSSFFAKANAAVAAGAVATIIYNNQSGTIGMNLTGYSYTNPVASITQADGNRIKADSTKVTTEDGITYYTGTMTISEKVGVSNPGEVEYNEMSAFSSWGVPSNLSLKPEITTPGGNIWSVNGAVAGGKAYESMSGTSMAAPQVAGLIAVFNQYARENDLPAKTGKTLRQLAISLLMSTAEPVVSESDGLYSVMKQGAGLANVNAAINARSYITIDSVTDTAPLTAAASIADGKVKVELGALEEDSFSTTFTLHNFSNEPIEYYLSADFFTQLIYAGYRLSYVDEVSLGLAWKINGVDFEPADAGEYDFNGDGVVNGVDAQYLLEYVAGKQKTIENAAMADFDADGDVDSYDARLAFEALSNAGVTAAAGEDVEVTLTVTGLDAAFGDYPNGNYIEGYITAVEGESNDGALGVTHTIPVLGFYGNWTDASMYDKTDLLDLVYKEDPLTPYLGTAYNSYMIQYAGDSTKYYFGGNPVVWDDEYMPERNAMNSDSVISEIQYVQIRNSAGSRFTVNKGNSTVYTQYGNGAYGAYYYRNQTQWRNTSASTKLGYTPKNLKDGTALTLKYELAPEYYVNADGSIRWNDLGDGAAISIPVVVDNTAPYSVDVTVEDATLTVLAHDNQYIAAVALYLEDGTMVDYYGGLADIRKGEQHAYDFGLSDFEEIPEHYLVEVYDYANNLSTFKLNLNTEELDGGLTGLTISPTSAKILKGSEMTFTVTAVPWGASEEVGWVSDDESVATVNANGVVTGVAPGTTLIRAISDEDETIFAEVPVTVFAVEATIYGGVQDVNGNPLFYGWDLANDETYSPLARLEHNLTAMSYDWLNDDGQYFYQQDFEGYMYQVDIDTMAVTDRSAATTAFGAPMEDFDFSFLYNNTSHNHRAYGVSEGYFLYSPDVMQNTFSRGYDIASYGYLDDTGASMFTAIAWAGQNSSRGDSFVVLDDAGGLWVFNLSRQGSLSTLGLAGQVKGLEFAIMEDTTGNSLVLGDDGELYLAHFNGSTSEVYWLAYDADEETFIAYRIGDFGDDVWPATLMMAIPNDTGDDGDAIPTVPAYMENAQVVAVELEETDFAPAIENAAPAEEEAAPVEETAAAPEGGLDSVKREKEDNEVGTEKVSTEVTIEIVADQLSKNGVIKVLVPETATLLSWSSNAEHKAWNDTDEGSYTFAFVDFEGFELDETILTLKFTKDSKGTITLITSDINDDDEQVLTETVILGPAESEHTVHTYGDPVFTWADDYSSAIATFTCTLNDGAVEVVDAVVTEEVIHSTDHGFTITYTATVEFEGKTYTDSKTVVTNPEDYKFVLEVSSKDSNNNTGAVTATVDADFVGRLIIDNGDVNTSNVAVNVWMNDVASLGVTSPRHFERKIKLSDSGVDVSLDYVVELFSVLQNAEIVAVADGESTVYTVVNNGRLLTATPDENVANVWRALVNSENITYGTKEEDSFIFLKKGSYVQIADRLLTVDKDLTLDNFGDPDALQATIRDAVSLHIVSDAADVITLYLEPESELALGSSYVRLNSDRDLFVTVDINGYDETDLSRKVDELRDDRTVLDMVKTVLEASKMVMAGMNENTTTVTFEVGHRYEIEWAWAEDNSSCTATFTCLNNGEHDGTVEAEVTSKTEGSRVTITATAVGPDGKTYKDVKIIRDEAQTKALLKQLLLYYTQYRNADGYVSDYTSEADYDIDRILADLTELDPYFGDAWKKALDYWDDALYPFQNGYTVNGGSAENPYGELPDGLPNDDSLVIVCLGYALNKTTGEMEPELIGRLQTTLNNWRKYPNAYIAVTGGGTAPDSAHPEHTEGGEMMKWLIAQGVPKNKIICEDKAGNTYGNAANTYAILAKDYPQVTNVAMITSTYHVPRGSVLFEIQFLETAAENGEECKIHVVANAGYYVDKPNYAANGGFEAFMMFQFQVPSIAGVQLGGGWGQPTPKPDLSEAKELVLTLASESVVQGKDPVVRSAKVVVESGDEFNGDITVNANAADVTCEVDTSTPGVVTATFSYTWKPGSAYEKTLTVEKEITVTKDRTEEMALIKELLLYYTKYRNSKNYVSDYTSEADYDIDRILADLYEVDPYFGNAWKDAIEYWDNALYPFKNGYSVNGGDAENPYGELPDGLPDDDTMVIVCLGFGLNPDGSMKDELIGRLEVLYKAWKKYPNAYVAVTGGGTAAQNPNVTEGGSMKAWLLENTEIPEEQIICEDTARNTYGNAANTYKILAAEYPQVTSVAMVTSTYHVPRGSVLFEIQFLETAAENGEECKVHIVANAGYYVEKTGSNYPGGFEGFSMFSGQVPSIPGVSLRGAATPALSVAKDGFELTLASDEVVQGSAPVISAASFVVQSGDTFNGDITIDVDPSEITCDIDTSVPGVQTVTFSYTWKPGSAYEKTYTVQKQVTVVPNEVDSIYRITDTNTTTTSLKVANEMKNLLGKAKFDAIVIATDGGFADALSGSYLAGRKEAPVILVNPDTFALAKDYIKANVAEGGKVYILGSKASVAESFEEGLEDFDVVRLEGSSRYMTNIAILEEAGMTASGDIVIATGGNYADSLSAGAIGLPIMMVDNKSTSLKKSQRTFLEQNVTGNIYILGDKNAVSDELADALKKFGSVTRIGGSSRWETTKLIGQKFVANPEHVVMACGTDFVDALIAGPLAHSLNSALILVASDKTYQAKLYVEGAGVDTGVIVGSVDLVSDEAVRKIFSLADDYQILVK